MFHKTLLAQVNNLNSIDERACFRSEKIEADGLRFHFGLKSLVIGVARAIFGIWIKVIEDLAAVQFYVKAVVARFS